MMAKDAPREALRRSRDLRLRRSHRGEQLVHIERLFDDRRAQPTNREHRMPAHLLRARRQQNVAVARGERGVRRDGSQHLIAA